MDSLGKAVTKADREACRCGANALLINRNSNDEHIGRAASSEEVDAIAIRLLPPSSSETPARSQKPSSASKAPAATRLLPRHSAIKAGFRDLNWGDPPTSDMTPSDTGEQGQFVRKSDTLKIGSDPVKRIVYGFKRNRFTGIWVFLGLPRAHEVLGFLTKTWGSPDETPPELPAEFIARWIAHPDLKESSVAIISTSPFSKEESILMIVESDSYWADSEPSANDGL